MGHFYSSISASIMGHKVGGCLVDEGNFVDIMYQITFECRGLRKENLRYFYGLEAIELIGTNARPWGYVTLDTNFGDGAGKRVIAVPFLVIPDASAYNCVFEHPTLAALDAVASTVHLKMKYHAEEGRIVTIHANLGDT